ncbi:MAG: SPOR domain-containing protein [Pseudomonadales bacterium]|nr:SPOR domain-containing protein [Pseudomonadales bacterium]
MTQDFAKIRPEPLLEKKAVDAPPAWSLLLTGMVLGVAVGVFVCVVLYLSGRVPPLTQATVASNSNNPVLANTPPDSTEAEQQPIELEFYTELQNYEVEVDATPVDLSSQDPERALDQHYMLQTGAFERRELAETEVSRQQALGLNVLVKQQNLVGRTLFLVQSGPYTTNGELDTAEQILRRNSIPSLRMAVQ